jgi:NADH-quinone oxidoreductase subunit L
LARALSGLYRVLADKFYVDEIYDAGIVRPIRRVSESFLAGVVDERLIDGAMVNGSGRMAARIGGWVSRLQGGLVNSYAFYFLLALCGIFFAMVIW